MCLMLFDRRERLTSTEGGYQDCDVMREGGRERARKNLEKRTETVSESDVDVNSEKKISVRAVSLR